MISTVLNIVECVLTVAFVATCVYFTRHLERKNSRLSSELERERDRRESAEKTIKAMQRRENGFREPDSLCIGCKHLITNQVLGAGLFPQTQYGCKKNIRCPEYEEDKTCSSKE